MTKYFLSDLVNRHQDTHPELSQAEAKRQVTGVLEALKEVTGTPASQLTIRGFGRFTNSERAAYTGRNPQNGQSVEVPAKQVLRFKAS